MTVVEVATPQRTTLRTMRRTRCEPQPAAPINFGAVGSPAARRGMSAMQFHPLANIFPLLEGDEHDALTEDIMLHGQHEPIVLYQDMILDGRNRYRACVRLGVPPVFEEYRGDDPLAYVISLNLRRRHLDESQRAMIADKVATMRQGERTDLEPSANLRKVSQQDAAKLLNVSERSITNAATVRREGVPELQRAVETGVASVSAAATAVRYSFEARSFFSCLESDAGPETFCLCSSSLRVLAATLDRPGIRELEQ